MQKPLFENYAVLSFQQAPILRAQFYPVYSPLKETFSKTVILKNEIYGMFS